MTAATVTLVHGAGSGRGRGLDPRATTTTEIKGGALRKGVGILGLTEMTGHETGTATWNVVVAVVVEQIDEMNENGTVGRDRPHSGSTGTEMALLDPVAEAIMIDGRIVTSGIESLTTGESGEGNWISIDAFV